MKTISSTQSVTVVLKLEDKWELCVHVHPCAWHPPQTSGRSSGMTPRHPYFLKTSTGVFDAQSNLRITKTNRGWYGLLGGIWKWQGQEGTRVVMTTCTWKRHLVFRTSNAWSIPQNEELTPPKCHWWKKMDVMNFLYKQKVDIELNYIVHKRLPEKPDSFFLKFHTDY